MVSNGSNKWLPIKRFLENSGGFDPDNDTHLYLNDENVSHLLLFLFQMNLPLHFVSYTSKKYLGMFLLHLESHHSPTLQTALISLVNQC